MFTGKWFRQSDLAIHTGLIKIIFLVAISYRFICAGYEAILKKLRPIYWIVCKYMLKWKFS